MVKSVITATRSHPSPKEWEATPALPLRNSGAVVGSCGNGGRAGNGVDAADGGDGGNAQLIGNGGDGGDRSNAGTGGKGGTGGVLLGADGTNGQ